MIYRSLGLLLLFAPAFVASSLVAAMDQPDQAPAHAETSGLDPEITATNIGNRFVQLLAQLQQLEVRATYKVTQTVKKPEAEPTHNVVEAAAEATMQPDSFRVEMKEHSSAKPDVVLSLRDGTITEKHWYPRFGYRTVSYPASDRMDGTGTEQFQIEPAIFSELGAYTCAMGEFTGTWVGGSYVGKGMALRDSATQLADARLNGQWAYCIAVTGYRHQDDQFRYTRDDQYWYDGEFRMVRHVIDFAQLPLPQSESDIEHRQTVDVVYEYGESSSK